MPSATPAALTPMFRPGEVAGLRRPSGRRHQYRKRPCHERSL